MRQPDQRARNLHDDRDVGDVASGQISRKVVGIATIAISSGTIAINDAKTNTRTSSAPAPASAASTARLAPPASSPSAAAARSALRPVIRDGRAADVDAGERGLRLTGLGQAGVDAAGRRDRDQREGGAAVLGDEGAVARGGVGRHSRAGSARSTFASAASSSPSTPGESTVVPSGSVTTGTSGAMLPPLP